MEVKSNVLYLTVRSYLEIKTDTGYLWIENVIKYKILYT